MKRRSDVLIMMQLLELLTREPRGPRRLAQAAYLNISYIELASPKVLTAGPGASPPQYFPLRRGTVPTAINLTSRGGMRRYPY